jgi:long-subunit fatty acid transport protein
MLLAAVLAIPSAAMATNGMYLAGYGTEANGRGGTDIAIADRALGLQSNPAGIAQLMGNHFTVDLQILMPDLDYGGDFFGNNLEG